MANKSHKGQHSALDVLAAISGLMIIVTLSFVLFAFVYNNIIESIQEREMQISTYYAFEQLLNSGNPVNWHFSFIDNYGLERQSSVLDNSKLIAFSTENYTLIKEKLGISKYNFSLNIYNYYNQTPLYSFGSANNSSTIITMQRIAILNDSLVLVKFQVAK